MPIQDNPYFELSVKVCNVYEIADQRKVLPVEFVASDKNCQIFSVEFQWIFHIL